MMGSRSRALTVAVLVIVPSAVGVTAMMAVAEAPWAKLGIRQKITWPAKVGVPLEKVEERMGALTGNTFVTVMKVAGLGPLFVTETV
jgi:hypothetical protein